MAKNKYNAIIVGAGAGGGVVAKQLATAGMKVLLLERGPWPSYDKHINDEILSQRTEALGPAFGPDGVKNPRVKIHTDGRREVLNKKVLGWDYNHNASCVGSGTVSYGAMAWRFMQEDFAMKTTYGHVEGSTLEDWPVSYEDMEPFYEQAEWEVGVSGDDYQNPYAPPRKKPHPMPPFPLNIEGKMLRDAAKRLNLSPFPIPMLRNSVAYNDRPACIENRMCCGFACPIDAKNGTQNTVIPVAMATGNCDVRANCKVAELIVDGSKIKGVKFFDEEDKGKIVYADVVVLAAAAIETARLMLNSKSPLFPNGVGNNHDWVGRNLQGHAYTGAFGVFDHDILDYTGPGATVAVSNYNHNNEGIIGGGILANEFNRLPYLFTQIRPPKAKRWGQAHKNFQRTNFFRTSQVVGPIQEMPNFDARVSVDPAVKDHWGVPVAVLSGHRHPRDYEHCKFLSARAEEILQEAGAVETFQHVGGKGLSGGQHQAGTCRMGNDKQTSVADKYCRVHDTDNLFLADGSSFPNNGGFNPALTIMANAFRVGEYIAKEWQRAKFNS